MTLESWAAPHRPALIYTPAALEAKIDTDVCKSTTAFGETRCPCPQTTHTTSHFHSQAAFQSFLEISAITVITLLCTRHNKMQIFEHTHRHTKFTKKLHF